MTDNRSKSEENVDTFFNKVSEEAEEFPVKTIDIPDEKRGRAGICLLAEERTPSSIDKVVEALSAGGFYTSYKTPRKESRSTLLESLSIEIERARFTTTALTLLLIRIKDNPHGKHYQAPASVLKHDLHRVDIVTTLDSDTIAVLMPETGGQAAEKRAGRFLADLGDMAYGCGIYSSYGDNCPEPEEFLKLTAHELERSCDQSGKITRNEYEEPPSCQVSVEEKNELFNLFGKDKP
jgi:hypothetical protein